MRLKQPAVSAEAIPHANVARLWESEEFGTVKSLTDTPSCNYCDTCPKDLGVKYGFNLEEFGTVVIVV